MELDKYKTNDLIDILDNYQKEIILELLQTKNEEEILDIWINVSGTDFTSKFGGNQKDDFLKNFKTEFNKFVLEDEKYNEEIKEFKSYANATKIFIVSFLTDLFSKVIGVSSVVVTPLVVLSLGIIGKIGLNAYKEMIKENDNTK